MPEAEQGGIKIKDLVDRTGVTRATIHHYVKEGLLPQPAKTSRNMALYDPDCVERVLLVKGLQKQQRRSLAEVKAIMEEARDNKGLSRLREYLDSEAAKPSIGKKPRPSVELEELAERTGFSLNDLIAFGKGGILNVKTRGGRKVCDPVDVDVADALGNLKRAGFDRETGFEARHLKIYLEAMRSLLQDEVSLFLEKVRADEDPQAVLERAQRGIEFVTPLILALRRKLLKELLDAALPESNGRKSAKKNKSKKATR